MNTVRLGIIGMGNIGRYHAGYLLEGKVPRCALTAVCSRHTAGLERFAPCQVFDDGLKLIRSGTVDAVLIATPHLEHPTFGMAAFDAGLHVMLEKPIAAHTADAGRLIHAHARHSGIIFAAMFQFRAEPRFQAMRNLIRSGALGDLVRVSWINTDWFRPDAYYASSPWRATWRGEGGGVLINQCLHNLDTLQWLVGMPSRVRGFCKLGRFHDIEVEDDVTAYLEWSNGATGTFVSATGESPGTNRLEVAGTAARLLLENDTLLLTRNELDAAAFCKSTEQPFAKPAFHASEVPFAKAEQPHAVLLRNFTDAILDGAPLVAPGAEGIHSLELANAIVYSSLLDKTVDLPLDGAAWEAKLKELIAASPEKRIAARTVAGDVASSFR